MRTLRIYCLNHFHITFISVSFIYHVVNYIPHAYLSHNWKFVPFDHLHLVPPPPPPTPLHPQTHPSFF